MPETLLPGPLVAVDWLAARLGDPAVRILDASWYLPTSGRDPRAEFREAHLPGARYFDLDAASAPDTALPHMLPTADRFAATMAALGVSDGDLVVAYDGSGANLSAARLWWMLRTFGHPRAAVLDGGLAAWRRAGLATEAGEPDPPPPGRFTARLDVDRAWDLERVRAAVQGAAAQVVDLRSAGRYAGRDPEPRPGLPSGHIPGSLSLPYTELVDAEGRAIGEDLLRERLAGAGIDLQRPVVGTCGSGTSACNLALHLARLGLEAAIYDGSWTEWVLAGMPVEPSPATGPTSPG